MKKILVPFFVLGHLAGLLAETKAQSPGSSPPAISPKTQVVSRSFYLSSIFDERVEADSIGTLLFSSNGSRVTHKIALESATFKGIAKILTDSIRRDTSLRPLSIRIKVCNITETLISNDRVSGEVSLAAMFQLDKKSGPIPLTQYRSTVRYNRPLTNLSIVEPTLRTVLGNSLKFINDWLNNESGKNPAFATGIKLSFSDYLEQHEDTVYYQPSRPLVWDDFREKRSDSKFVASVFPSFGYDQRSKIDNGIIDVELVMKVFVIKSASWVDPGTKSIKNLQHEQKHFDLVKIIAERFKRKLLSEKLTPENYQGIINFEYLEFYREMNKIQEEYDDQTSHGTSSLMQEFWNRKIEEELNLVDN